MKNIFAPFAASVALVSSLGILDSEADAKPTKTAQVIKKSKVHKPAKSAKSDHKPKAKVEKKQSDLPKSKAATPLVKNGSCDISEVLSWKPVEIFINTQTGEVIGDATDANKRAFFSSATKLMPAYIALDRMKNGTGKDRISKDERIPIQHRSYRSASKSKYLQSNDPIPAFIDKAPAEQILRAVFTRSSNDGPNALAIRISGSLKEFYSLENEYARRLGVQGNWASATGFNTAEAVKSHWQTPLGMAKLMSAAYSEFGDDLKSYYGRSKEVYGFKKGSDTKTKFTLKSKIEAFDSDYQHRIKGLEIMKPGFTCFGGIAAVGVVNVKGIDFAFAYAGYRSKEQRDMHINKTVLQIGKDIASGKIQKFEPIVEPLQKLETVKAGIAPQDEKVSIAPPEDSTLPDYRELGLLGIFVLAAGGLGLKALTRSKSKEGFINSNIATLRSNEPISYLPMGGSLLTQKPC